jgi:prepilin-type N-terminal cleavage/methylation domain-containing protein
MTSRLQPPPNVRGYTLVEMLVVLALLALMAAAAWPSLRAPWGKTQVEDAGNQARIALARARVKAIESGVAWRFRYRPGSGRFEYEPVPQGVDPRQVATNATDATGNEGEDAAGDRVEGELPHGVRFGVPNASDSPSATLKDMQGDNDAEWSAPILLYPNGRATSARFRLVGAKDMFVDVTLRGLTGVAKVGKPQRAAREEDEPRAEVSR